MGTHRRGRHRPEARGGGVAGCAGKRAGGGEPRACGLGGGVCEVVRRRPLARALGRSRPRPGDRRRLRRHAGAPARRAGHRRGRGGQARPLREADGDGRRRVRSHDRRVPRPITSRLGVAYYRHFYPVVARVREILGRGEIGTPVLAQIDAFERFNPQPQRGAPLVRQAGGVRRRSDVRLRVPPARVAAVALRSGARRPLASRPTSSSIARWRTRPSPP